MKAVKDHVPLVSLKHVSSGAGGSVFCFPGAGDSITSFMPIVDAITLEYPIYGLQPRGLVGGQEPYTDIDSMVNVYMQHIASRLNDNFAYLIGHSFGGYVAMRLAETLMENNQKVAPLILLDVTAPEIPLIHKSRADNLFSLIETMELACGQKYNIDRSMLSESDDDAQLQLIHREMVVNGMLPTTSKYETIRGMVNLFIANCNMEFIPDGVFNGDAMLVTAEDSTDTKQQRYENNLAWKKHIPSLVNRESPGNHITLLNNVNARNVVDRIERFWADVALGHVSQCEVIK